MKKRTLILLMSIFLLPSIAFAQDAKLKKNKAEVLYFKDRLPCCKGRACNILQSDVDSVVTKNFADKKVAFRVIYMTVPENKELVEKYKAKSQTVLVIKKKRKKETIVDLTPIVKSYQSHRDKAKFETEMKAKIKEVL